MLVFIALGGALIAGPNIIGYVLVGAAVFFIFLEAI